MKKLGSWLRSLTVGEGIALTIAVAGMLFVAVLSGISIWDGLLSLIPPKPKIKGTDLDLVAQQSMAAAAWVMVWFAAVSSAVGAFGLFMIFRTLQETARSADAALLNAQISQAAMKPFVTVEYANIVMDADGFIRISYKVRNSGSSPAYDVAFQVKFIAKSANIAQQRMETNTKSRSDIEAGGTKQAFASFARDGAAELCDDNGNFVAVIQIDVVYRDIFKSPERVSVTYGRFMNYFSMREEVSLYRDVETIGWGD